MRRIWERNGDKPSKAYRFLYGPRRSIPGAGHFIVCSAEAGARQRAAAIIRGMADKSAPNVSLMFVAKPWWMRFFKALELAIFGSVWFEGKIAKIEERGSSVDEPRSTLGP